MAHRLRLNVKQRIAINIALLQRRRDLTDAVYGEKFEPRATCPNCGHGLNDYEIMIGFNRNPRDYTTGCPKCKHRFAPDLHRAFAGGSVILPFYCPDQTLCLLEPLAETLLVELMEKYAGIYYSAVTHFGGIKQAFARLGVAYAHAEAREWRKVVENFLGKMPDAMIAEIVGTSPSTIRRLRNRAGVVAYNRRQEAEDMAEES